MSNVYLGRQPILDIHGKICSFELHYKDASKQTNINSQRHASASVISSILNKFGTNKVLGTRRAFVKIDEKFLLHDLIFSIPNEFFIFSLLPDIEMNEKVLERLEQLQERGYELCIDDSYLDKSYVEKYIDVFELLSYVKVKLNTDISGNAKEAISRLKEYGLKVVATKIDTHEQYDYAKSLGCDMYSGYYFAKPKILEDAKYESSQMEVLKLYNLLMDDTNIDEITSEFEKNHEITVQLLRFINSGAFHFRNKISSIHHILTLVGRIPLAQWLMLMIYSKSVSKGDEKSALMVMVKNRTELMQQVLKKIQPDVQSNTLGEAYFIGVLSLIDTVFHVKLQKILQEMNISVAVKDALMEHKGTLGEIYKLVKAIEVFDIRYVKEFEIKYKLEDSSLEQIALESMKEVEKFEHPNQ